MRESDYRKGDYYDCARCGDFVSRSRAKLVKKRDAHFGRHYLLVCAKH